MKRLNKLDFPTPESPIRTTEKKNGVSHRKGYVSLSFLRLFGRIKQERKGKGKKRNLCTSNRILGFRHPWFKREEEKIREREGRGRAKKTPNEKKATCGVMTSFDAFRWSYFLTFYELKMFLGCF